MQAPWIFSASLLPHAGEPIDFLLEDRGQPIHGTFAAGFFHSRWADYGADRVQAWRGSQDGGPAAPMAIGNVVAEGAFFARLKRLATLFSGARKAVPPGSAHRRRQAP